MFARFRIRRCSRAAALAVALGAVTAAGHAVELVPQLGLTDSSADDQDDICIWLHPTQLALSTIIASDKHANLLFVYDLQGGLVQELAVPGQPGNIDLRYGFPWAGAPTDIVVFNDRTRDLLVVHEIDPVTRTLTRIDDDDLASPSNYGLCLYRSPFTRAFHVFTTTKTGTIRQFELFDSGSGLVMTPVRTWQLDGSSEGCVADDELGVVYFAEEDEGIWRLGAEPGDATPGTMIATVGDGSGLAVDVEGLTLYYAAGGQGYVFAASQGTSTFHVYERTPPHAPAASFTVAGVGSTDGIDVTNASLGAAFPSGIFVTHNGSAPHQVEVCAYEDLGLAIDSGYWNPRQGAPTRVPRLESGAELTIDSRPNPFSRGTRISFGLVRPASVSLRIIDAAGRRVAELVRERRLGTGRHTYRWDGRTENGSPAVGGVYFCRLEADSETATVRTTRIR